MRTVRQSPKDCARLAHADELLHVKGDVDAALAVYRDVLKRFPDDPELLFHTGSAELTAGRLDDARRHLSRSVRTTPTPGACRALAKVHDLSGDADAALAEIDRGLSLAPNDPALLAARADALFVRGNVDDAHAILAPLIETDQPHHAVISAFTRLCHRVDRLEDGVALIERRLDDAPPPQQAVLAFRLADLLDRKGDYGRAFAAAERANRLRAFPFDADAFTARIDAAIEHWTAPPESPGADASRPIFIVGMPRSGTSLAEQIIASHPSVRAGGERAELTAIAVDLGADPAPPPVLTTPDKLTKPAINRASRRYLNDLRKVDRNAAHVTDKMPTNFLNLGLARAILPGAKIVHCIRDPRDVCLSCFFQSFAAGLPFAGDLVHLAAVHNAERRLMAHWKAHMPVFDLVYEDLVADLPTVARRLIDFLGLDWNDACATPWRSAAVSATASIDQVRQPVYTRSVGRWRNYKDQLQPLITKLD